MSVRKILVTGATGKQGGGVIDALIAHPPPYPHEILALTRNVNSPAAQKLANKAKNITLLAGDLNNCPEIFTKAGGYGSVWGVFSVQAFVMGQARAANDVEKQQGISLVDAALAAGVTHFVYTSADRGGSNSINDPTNVPHFISKHKIELHLIEVVGDSNKNKHGMTYTIFRPVCFYENLIPDFRGKGFTAMWAKLGSVPLQFVAVRDIGIFVVQAFKDADSDSKVYRNNSFSLAGDELTVAQASKIFEKVYGKKLPVTFGFVGSLVKFMIKEMGIMFQWFADVGFKADIAENKRLNPEMQDFETWLKMEGKLGPNK